MANTKKRVQYAWNPEALAEVKKQFGNGPELLGLAVNPGTLDEEKRSVECCFITGAVVERVDWSTGEEYELQFSFEDGACQLDRLNNGAPVLDNHNSYTLGAVLGVVENARIEGGRGLAALRFSKRPEVEPFFQDVKDGIIQNLSMGVVIDSLRDITEKGAPCRRVLAVDWYPFEVSLVPVPGDYKAGFLGMCLAGENLSGGAVSEKSLKGENLMGDEVNTGVAGGDVGAVPDVEKLRDEGVKAERLRASEIKGRVSAVRLSPEFGDKLIELGLSVDEASKRIFEELGKGETETRRSGVEVVRDGMATKLGLMGEAMLSRIDPGKFVPKNGNEYFSMSMVELAKECLALQGVNPRGLSKSRVVEMALGSGQRELLAYSSISDFPSLLANLANKTLMAAYTYAPPSYKRWCKQNFVADFKMITRARAGEFPGLLPVDDSGEIKFGAIGDAKEQYALATIGRIFSISRQAIISDDLRAFQDLGPSIGIQAALAENKAAYAILTVNANMSDGVALFHANHGNLAGSGAVISLTTLDSGRAAMRVQKGLDGATPLNVSPRFLIVPAAKEFTALQYTQMPNVIVAKQADANPLAGTFDVVPEALLDISSTISWYLAADPNMVPTVEYSYLEGSNGPSVSSRVGFETDGVDIRVVHDFAAKAIDYRGLYKNGGA